MRRSVWLAICAAALLLMAPLGCAQSKPERSRAAEPDSRQEVRTIKREAVTEVVVDERFFEPYLLGSAAPDPLKAAYRAYIEGREEDARKGLAAFLKDKPDHSLAAQAGFLLGALEARADQHAEASARFEGLIKAWPLLEDHAAWRAAQSAFEAEQHDRAEAMCRAIPMTSPFGARSRHLRAQAIIKQGRRDEGIEVLQSLVQDFPQASFIGQVKLDLAIALEQADRFAEAAGLYHELRNRYAGRWLEKHADKGIGRVKPKLSKQDAARILTDTPADLVARARALDEIHRSEEVVKEMAALINGDKIKEGEPIWCEAAYLHGHAWRKQRKHNEAADGYARFLKACPKHDDVIQALYSGARSLWTVDRDDEALAWFERVWTEFPAHSYADDAVLYAARIHEGNNRRDETARLLEFQVQTFPRGDMLGSAHWMRFLDHYRAGRFKEAVAYVEGVGEATGEVDIYSRGRLAYFRARALEQSNHKKKAIEGFVEVTRVAPMSYYALLALNRLKAIDAARFEATIKALASDGAARKAWTVEPPELAEDPRFKRGVALLRLGLFEAAQDEFDLLRRQHSGHEQMLWMLTLLFDRAGAYHLSHNIPRREIGSFGTTYPVGRELDMFLLAYPRPFLEHVAPWASKRAIPEALVYAIMREESGFNPRIESWANAYGLMQLILPTAQDMARADDLKSPSPKRLRGKHLFEPALNIRLGTRFLSALFESYGKHPVITIAGYNGGFGNVDRWLKERGQQPLDLWVEEIPFGQTRHYTKRVLTSLWTYQWLYGAGEAADVPPASRVIDVSMKLPPPSR